jgi:hypothetical protein
MAWSGAPRVPIDDLIKIGFELAELRLLSNTGVVEFDPPLPAAGSRRRRARTQAIQGGVRPAHLPALPAELPEHGSGQ